eukprot:TRINITY_DN49246_c0_g1_i1.p1 TRINITY_DN49246_c0_g1~~TRINITY_DN49246_c0_g1_i1.p1  ORF type:complete len:269 (-),score=66.86 TRINITY_DN49246_c0_g1_i1:154-960(-)
MATAAVMSPAEVPQPALMPAAVQLAVQMITGKEILQETDFPATATVANVKQTVRSAIGLPEHHQKLVWQDAIVENGIVLGELLPPQGALLQLIVQIPPKEDIEHVRLLVEGASAALQTVSLRDLNELKRLPRPPIGVDLILGSVMHLLAGVDPAVAVNSRGRVKDDSWPSAQKMMTNPRAFLDSLLGFKALVESGQVPQRNFDAVQRIRTDMGANFCPQAMAKKSCAAAGLTSWLLNILMYHEVMQRLRSEFGNIDDIMAEVSEQLSH